MTSCAELSPAGQSTLISCISVVEYDVREPFLIEHCHSGFDAISLWNIIILRTDTEYVCIVVTRSFFVANCPWDDLDRLFVRNIVACMLSSSRTTVCLHESFLFLNELHKQAFVEQLDHVSSFRFWAQGDSSNSGLESHSLLVYYSKFYIEKIRKLQGVLGGIVDPHAAYLLIRGLKTLRWVLPMPSEDMMLFVFVVAAYLLNARGWAHTLWALISWFLLMMSHSQVTAVAWCGTQAGFSRHTCLQHTWLCICMTLYVMYVEGVYVLSSAEILPCKRVWCMSRFDQPSF